MAEPNDRFLVVCVDRDDDLGRKTKVQAPVVGRDAVLAAANKLILADPEEADANAVFATVKAYDELKSRGIDCDVALLCGSEGRGFDADRRISSDAASLAKTTKATGFIFVSDGGDDENVIPLLQSVRPIISVERVAVKHSESVEETYLILGRYLRMLIFESRYSRWTLGVPGLILLLAGVLIVSNRVFEAQIATLLIIGGAFIVRGFSVDRSVARALRSGPYGYVRLFSNLSALLIFFVGISEGYANADAQASGIMQQIALTPVKFFTEGGIVAGYFLQGALPLMWVSFMVFTVGALLVHLVRGSVRAYRDGVVIVMLGLLYLPVSSFAGFLVGGERELTVLLVSYVLLGLAAIFGLAITIYARVRTKATSSKG